MRSYPVAGGADIAVGVVGIDFPADDRGAALRHGGEQLSLVVIGVVRGFVGNRVLDLCHIAKLVVLVLVILRDRAAAYGVFQPGNQGGRGAAGSPCQIGIRRLQLVAEASRGQPPQPVIGERHGVAVRGDHRGERPIRDGIAGIAVIGIGFVGTVNDPRNGISERCHPVVVVVLVAGGEVGGGGFLGAAG